jgi:predicted enzyme related to lactoylglutathione lyase
LSNIIATFANVQVPSLDAAIPLYERLTGTSTGSARRFSYEHLRLASVGPFLLIEGELEGNMAEQVATILVHSIEQVIAEVEVAGGEVLEGPDVISNGNGARIITRHPDGVIFEFMQPARPQTEKE